MWKKRPNMSKTPVSHKGSVLDAPPEPDTVNMYFGGSRALDELVAVLGLIFDSAFLLEYFWYGHVILPCIIPFILCIILSMAYRRNLLHIYPVFFAVLGAFFVFYAPRYQELIYDLLERNRKLKTELGFFIQILEAEIIGFSAGIERLGHIVRDGTLVLANYAPSPQP